MFQTKCLSVHMQCVNFLVDAICQKKQGKEKEKLKKQRIEEKKKEKKGRKSSIPSRNRSNQYEDFLK